MAKPCDSEAVSPPIAFRREARAGDPANIRRIVESTGFFNAAEIEIAVELAADRLERGAASGYHFIFAEAEGRTIGYVCHGPIDGTRESFDLYWIVVEEGQRGRGAGRSLMAECEREIFAMGGRRVYVETSSREQYDPTRRFYLAGGYRIEAMIEDFYAPGDSKAILVKVLAME